MDSYRIRGGQPLMGHIGIGGSPIAAVPALAACLMAEGVTTLSNLPRRPMIEQMGRLLEELGCRIERQPQPGHRGDTWRIKVDDESRCHATYSIVRALALSCTRCVLGPLLARRGRVSVCDPAGSSIGDRPLPEAWFQGLKSMGARFEMDGDDLVCRVRGRLRGRRLYIDATSRLGLLDITNIICAAAMAEGVTTLVGAPCNPEVVDLIHLLNRMGAQITGAGGPEIRIEGVERLKGCEHRLMPDRIECGLWMIAAAITGGELQVTACNPHHLPAEIDLLGEMGIDISMTGEALHVRSTGRLSPAIVRTAPYPGFASDLQPLLTALLCLVDGRSLVTEGVSANRFGHLAELRRMGAKLRLDGRTVVIQGVARLFGTHVMASDAQSAAAMLLAGLVASGTTQLDRVYHLDRRYGDLDQQLRKVGAQIERIQDNGVT